MKFEELAWPGFSSSFRIQAVQITWQVHMLVQCEISESCLISCKAGKYGWDLGTGNSQLMMTGEAGTLARESRWCSRRWTLQNMDPAPEWSNGSSQVLSVRYSDVVRGSLHMRVPQCDPLRVPPLRTSGSSTAGECKHSVGGHCSGVTLPLAAPARIAIGRTFEWLC